MKISTGKGIQLSLGACLTLLFVICLGGLIYLAYDSLIAEALNVEITVPESSIVRVNVPAYEDAIDYLKDLERHIPPPRDQTRANPFQ